MHGNVYYNMQWTCLIGMAMAKAWGHSDAKHGLGFGAAAQACPTLHRESGVGSLSLTP